ncbi:hypothetical protein BU26DRAFT_609665 [Trematosphaeria pertusa]|uniref:Ribosomal protein S21 n=1 Tax=Trematosphaeria pertusa TaxID=390896 RepID=A0A6A6HXK5_9PLEO|nr:uncharacterized protein BU26DRAFT_609665 [Trematosphaeria pertusa]KAF2242945.1 hypothetical protein BU26DRAFT_609665 [Trematosphaeria pertusa]
MGSRSIGELLLRPSSISRISFSPCTSSSTRALVPSWGTRRTLTTSPPRHAAQSQPKEESLHESHPKTASDQQTSEAIDGLFRGVSSNRAAPSHPPRRTSPSSADELSAARAQQAFGEGWSRKRGNIHLRTPLSIDEMNMPDLESEKDLPPSTLPKPDTPFPRLNPSYGRSVELAPDKGRDLVRGIGILGSLMARNKVKADAMKQRFHERPGLKRKRLKSQRWRARFKIGFRHVTARVSELTRKGW